MLRENEKEAGKEAEAKEEEETELWSALSPGDRKEKAKERRRGIDPPSSSASFWHLYSRLGSLAILLVLVVAGCLALLRNTRLLSTQDSVWLDMKERGNWRVALDPSFPPFESLDAQGQPIGYDIDLAREMASDWGLVLEIVPIGYDSLLDALLTSQTDSIVSAFPYDPRVTKDVAFSPPYFEAGVRLAVHKAFPLPQETLSKIDDFAHMLQGKVIAVEIGSMADMIGRRLQRLETTIELQAYQTPRESVNALLSDHEVEALLVDNVTLREAQGTGAPIVAIGSALEGNPYVIAAPLSATTLQKAIAETLHKFEKNGTLTRLEEQWFGDNLQGSTTTNAH